MKNVAATSYGKKSVVRPLWAGLSVMNDAGDGRPKTPTAGDADTHRRIGTNGDITPKGLLSALSSMPGE
ncbi:hypothetical protein K6L09_44515, partial [Burkholderia cepacia]